MELWSAVFTVLSISLLYTVMVRNFILPALIRNRGLNKMSVFKLKVWIYLLYYKEIQPD